MNLTAQRDMRYEDDLFDKAFDEHTRGIEEHAFRHYNNSIGCMIYNKAHYKVEMKSRGMVPYFEMEKLAEEWDKTHKQQSFDEPSPKAMMIIKSLKMSADKYGNLKLGDKAIDALIEIGAIRSESEHTPKEFQDEGGFS